MFDWEVKTNSKSLAELEDNLILSREIVNRDEFFKPKDSVMYINSFPSEFIENVKKAKELVFEAIKAQKPIIIHGDYDADGVISTSILFSTIKDFLNYPQVSFLIPDRFEDGYGLSDKTLQKILEMSPSQNFLLITVDCGITSISQVEKLKELGNSVIVTDHHHMGEMTPSADALIWSDKVVGSTLSWILCLSLGNKDSRLISMVATATITDVFPLKDFNRALVKEGLEILRRNPPISFKRLLENQNIKIEDVSVYHLGFVIGPRLNSSGRVADARLSTTLILEKDPVKIDSCLAEINLLNQRRQKYTSDSIEKFRFNKDSLPRIIVLYDEDFHEGVVGLIASKIVQEYHRPALVISRNEDFLKGSARSIKGINIINIINEFKHYFKGCGGHELAAGFSLEEENLEPLKLALQKYMEEHFTEEDFKKRLKVDSEIDLSMINFDLMELLKKFEPFGPANEEPIFLIKNARLTEIKKIGQNKNHLSLMISQGNFKFKGLFFSYPEEFEYLYLGQDLDVVFKAKVNEFNGKTNIDLHILDIKTNS